jgi:NRAMP (natural resistance-associated macrophage protein)-like metal ion transporter
MTEKISNITVQDHAPLEHIRGAFGTILHGDIAPRETWKHRLTTLLAIIGPGLIVMAGDNDAGAFATYGQAGQNYGTTLLWTMLVLIPVLYVNQEMVLRLGAVTKVGHARLIFKRFGKFWGMFSVVDLFILNSLTVVTEFIGISLALNYLGLNKTIGVIVSAIFVVGAASTGDFRRFERFAMALVFGSLLFIPIYIMIHPPFTQVVYDSIVPQLPSNGKLNDVMLMIIGLVGTTIAPWQLFFQQSYVIDKHITPRFIKYERVDLWLGIALSTIGSIAIISIAAATFKGHTEFGNFTDAGAITSGVEKYVNKSAGIMFALALIDASLIGASAVSLSTAYAIGDIMSSGHSLHNKITNAKGFYAVYAFIIAISAIVVLTPGSPLGLLTVAVQVLAGVLLPSATVFLLLLCNDKSVLGPWVNNKWSNYFTSAVIGLLVLLSTILTISVIFPDVTNKQVIFGILGGGAFLGIGVSLFLAAFARKTVPEITDDTLSRDTWRMPPISQLPPAVLTTAVKTWMFILRLYLLLAGGLIFFRIIMLAVNK